MAGSESARSAFVEYIQKPIETTCLILVAEKPDFRTKPFNELKKKEIVFEFAPFYDDRIPGWIESRCGSFGISIDAEACRLLHASAGNSLRVLNNELEKLLTYISDRERITADDILHVVGVTKGNSIFDLQNALGQADLQKALSDHPKDDGNRRIAAGYDRYAYTVFYDAVENPGTSYAWFFRRYNYRRS